MLLLSLKNGKSSEFSDEYMWSFFTYSVQARLKFNNQNKLSEEWSLVKGLLTGLYVGTDGQIVN